MEGNLADIITCAKFQDDIFRGYDFSGDPISHFPIDFCMGLTRVQLYTAQPVMCWISNKANRFGTGFGVSNLSSGAQLRPPIKKSAYVPGYTMLLVVI